MQSRPRESTGVHDSPQVLTAQVCLVRRHCAHGEVVRRLRHQAGERRGVVDIGLGDLHSRHDLGVDPAHDMGFEEPGRLLFLAPFVVEPASMTAGGKAAGIGGEVDFNGPQRQGALLDQGLQNRRNGGVSMYRKAVLNDGQVQNGSSSTHTT